MSIECYLLNRESFNNIEEYANFYVKYQVGLYEAEVADLHRDQISNF